MHKWNENLVNILGTPDQTEWKTNLDVPANASVWRTDEFGVKTIIQDGW